MTYRPFADRMRELILINPAKLFDRDARCLLTSSHQIMTDPHVPNIPPRSPAMTSANRSALAVIDIQERLIGSIHRREDLLFHTQQLIDGSHLWKMPILLSEQYPEKLGSTLSSLQKLPPADSKRMFSCRELLPVWGQRFQHPVDTLVVCGIETHVCIQQTCLDFLSLGWNIVLVTDAVSSRFESDHQMALRRLEGIGVTLTTTESLLFEWCESSIHPNFKATSEIVKRRGGSR